MLAIGCVSALASAAQAQTALPPLPASSASAPTAPPAPPSPGSVSPDVAAAPTAQAPVDAAAWGLRFDAAGRRMAAGDFGGAIQDYSALASDAPNETARISALAQLRVAAEYALRPKSGSVAAPAPSAAVSPPAAVATPDNELPVPPPRGIRDPSVRTTDELVFLYLASPVYGITTGLFFDALVAGKSTASGGAFFSSLGATGLSVLAIAMIDNGTKLRYGGAQSVTTGLSVGFAEGVAMAMWAASRASDSYSTYRKTTAYIWGLSTAGIVAGSVVAANVPTTPGRSSWVGSTALAGGLLVGGLAGALTPDDPTNRSAAIRNFGLTAAVGGLAGVGAGILSASRLSPSLARVRFIDLGWLSGSLLSLGFCETYANQAGGCTSQAAFGALGVGAGAGFLIGVLATQGMQRDPIENHSRDAAPPQTSFLETLSPTIMPTQGGVTLGVAGGL